MAIESERMQALSREKFVLHVRRNVVESVAPQDSSFPIDVASVLLINNMFTFDNGCVGFVVKAHNYVAICLVDFSLDAYGTPSTICNPVTSFNAATVYGSLRQHHKNCGKE